MNIKPGGFWIRFVSWFIDQCIVGIVGLPLQFGLMIVLGLAGAGLGENASEAQSAVLGLSYMLGSWFFSAVIIFFYFGWFYKNKGATPGKMIFGLKVIDDNTGANIGYWRSFGREFGVKIFCFINFLLIGYLVAGLRQDKRGLHDLILSTRVVRQGE